MSPSNTNSKRRFRPDWFVVAIICTAVFASFVPARGWGIPVSSHAASVLIFILFYLYGVRIEPREALAGLKHWRLHAVILSLTYLMFPIFGLALGLFMPQVIGPDLYRGLLWVCLVPSTVQSSINFTSIARGNVAGAVVSASMSNLLGVIVTPLLAMAVMGATGLHIRPSSILNIVAQILLPFVLGQLTRRWAVGFVNKHKWLRLVDQISILVVVYNAFSEGVRSGIWTQTSVGDLVILLAVELCLLFTVLWITWRVAGLLKFNRKDQIAIQFCGTKKSLATGVPMASVLFPASIVGFIVLPLMIFHQAQLMACGALAGRYARQDEAWHDYDPRALQAEIKPPFE